MRPTRYMFFVAISLLAGCFPPSPDPFPYPMTEGNELVGSQVSVGLRFTLDPEPGKEHQVRLAAVIQDLRGNISVTDLGAYEGTVSERPRAQGELAHIAIVEGGTTEMILRRADGWVEIHQVGPSGDEIIQRIPLEADTAVPREPGLELNETAPE